LSVFDRWGGFGEVFFYRLDIYDGLHILSKKPYKNKYDDRLKSVREDMDVNEHDRLSNSTLRHTLM